METIGVYVPFKDLPGTEKRKFSAAIGSIIAKQYKAMGLELTTEAAHITTQRYLEFNRVVFLRKGVNQYDMYVTPEFI